MWWNTGIEKILMYIAKQLSLLKDVKRKKTTWNNILFLHNNIPGSVFKLLSQTLTQLGKILLPASCYSSLPPSLKRGHIPETWRKTNSQRPQAELRETHQNRTRCSDPVEPPNANTALGDAVHLWQLPCCRVSMGIWCMLIAVPLLPPGVLAWNSSAV